MNLPTDLQNDLIEVFDKIRDQKIGNKNGEYDCANDEALKLIEPVLLTHLVEKQKLAKKKYFVSRWKKDGELPDTWISATPVKFFGIFIGYIVKYY